MIFNHFIPGWRNLFRNKVFSLINICGLSLGMSAGIIIYLMVQFDYSHDTFHSGSDRIYRVVSNLDFAGTPWKTAGVPGALFAPLSGEIKGIETATPLIKYNAEVEIFADPADLKTFKDPRDLVIVAPAYFDLFRYQWIAGNPSSLDKPYTVILTEARARKYFNGLDPANVIGKTLRYTGDSILATVTGIVHSLPENTELIFNEFISYATFSKTGLRKRQGLDSWPGTNSNCQVLLKLSELTSKAQFERDINILRSKNIDSTHLKGNFTLQPLTDIHFDDVYGNYKTRTANRAISKALMLVALFLILLGCVNFINLSTANAPARSKEIGIRKTLGSLRSQLTVQFISETFLIVCLAMLISILTMPLFLKLFKDFIPEEINLSSLLQPHVILFFISLIAIVTLLGGMYPAVVLSGFNPVTVLKGGWVKGGSSSAWMRKGLTLFQLITAQVFILGTLLVLKQVNFLIHKDPGFNKDAVVNIDTPLNPFTDQAPDQIANVFKEKLKSIPGIDLVSRGSMAPSSASWSSRVLNYYRDQVKVDVNAQVRSGDSMFLNLYQIPILIGRSPKYINDSVSEFVINETMAAQLGVQDYSKLMGTSFGSKHNQTITGVCKDFNMKSLHQPIEPMVFTVDPDNSFTFHVRINKQIERKQYARILDQVKTYYLELFPKSEFQYFFVDEEMNKFYATEAHIAKLIRWCMGLAIFICCLGLLGMVMHSVQTRVKEVGVRKVLGASIPDIIQLLMKDFVWIVFLSIFIAAPVVYLLANKWLNKFAYRTEISWWIFPAGGLILLGVTSLTLSFNILRAARANPTTSLRSE